MQNDTFKMALRVILVLALMSMAYFQIRLLEVENNEKIEQEALRKRDKEHVEYRQDLKTGLCYAILFVENKKGYLIQSSFEQCDCEVVAPYLKPIMIR